jgi:phospholipid/cholesterol/gamma-HCH transport system ATP-binding protein
VIRCEGLTLRYGRTTVLEDVGFEVPTGKTLGLIGAGGAGKTCVLKLICGLIRPQAGRILVDDDEITALDETALMAVRGRIGMIFQNYALFDFMNVGDNIAFPYVQVKAACPSRRDSPSASASASPSSALAMRWTASPTSCRAA